MGLVEMVSTRSPDVGDASRITASDVVITDDGRAYYEQHCGHP
jgi:hypothetical protein